MESSPWGEILGPVFTLESVAMELGLTIPEVERAAQNLELLRIVTEEGVSVFPAFQFADGRPVSGLGAVLRALKRGVDDPLAWATWLVTPTHRPPHIDELAAGRREWVLQEAERAADSWSA